MGDWPGQDEAYWEMQGIEQAIHESTTDRQKLAGADDIEWVDRFGLNDSEYPLTDSQWRALYIQRTKAVYSERCNWHRPGHGICMKATIGRPRAHADGISSHSYVRIPDNPTTQRKGTDMARNTEQIAAELRAIEAEEQRLLDRKLELQKQTQRLLDRPTEPRPGAVVTFTVQFDPGGINYTFAAIRAAGKWYTTGGVNHRGPYTWQTLLDLVERDYSAKTGATQARINIYEDGKARSW